MADELLQILPVLGGQSSLSITLVF